MQFALYSSLLTKVHSMRNAQAETRNPGWALGAGVVQREKTRALVLVKEAIIVGRELGASNADLARLLGTRCIGGEPAV